MTLNVIKRYFVDRNGAVTGRAQGEPGKPHIEAAKLLGVTFDPQFKNDWYEPLFRQKFMRVSETAEKELHVDAPYAQDVTGLPNAQRRWLKDMAGQGWKVVYNRRDFIETRDKAAKVAAALLA